MKTILLQHHDRIVCTVCQRVTALLSVPAACLRTPSACGEVPRLRQQRNQVTITELIKYPIRAFWYPVREEVLQVCHDDALRLIVAVVLLNLGPAIRQLKAVRK